MPVHPKNPAERPPSLAPHTELNTPLLWHVGTQQNAPVGLVSVPLFRLYEFLEGPDLIFL